MKTNQDWKSLLAGRLGGDAGTVGEERPEAAAPAESEPSRRRGATLRIELDRHGRKGKPVTLVTGYDGDEEELARLTRLLQSRVGAGGSHCFNSEEPYDGQILIQGDCRTRVADLLRGEGYRVRVISS